MPQLFVVGIGPGGYPHITPAARDAIEAAEVVVGYRTYLDFIPDLLRGKELVSTGMTREVERCRQALDIAAAGRTTALVSSGDAGVYGMAGLVLELVSSGLWGPVEIEIVPGISAVQAAAARLGAPLMHDFAVVSLSDLLTPWESIRRRLEAAASADFVVALYNPKSRGRIIQLSEARQILLRHRSPETPVGIVRNACRDGEEVTIATLGELPEEKVDMMSIVLVGNSSTLLDNCGRMVTPRGYKIRSQEPGAKGQEEKQRAAPGRALFIGGTGSDVGKSVIAAGICRILRRQGFSVAPFKAQNMALNSAVTPEGGEIGRAQALQAAACGVAPHTDMNPILLKPNSETGSQVIVQGRPVANMDVRAYHAYKGEAFSRVKESFARLAASFDVVVMEGAGSIAEVNLREHDIANLRAAAMADAPVLLVADIDRGGVFASVVGTLELLEPQERSRIAGVVINKFRGDPSLLVPGIALIEERTGVPVLGVVPWISLHLPEEDSLALARKKRAAEEKMGEAAVRIGVVRLPHLSNYTDFDPLEREEGVELLYLQEPSSAKGLDLLIIPGTKNTLEDLAWLKRTGFADAILTFHGGGGLVAGICGGFQILGRRVSDPGAVESLRGEEAGLGLLDAETLLCAEKQTHQGEGVFLADAAAAGFAVKGEVRGYEIHMGETLLGAGVRPLLRLMRRNGHALEDGAVCADGSAWGTYLHGFFDNNGVRRDLLNNLRSRRGLPEATLSLNAGLDAELDRLADHLVTHLDLEMLFESVGLKARKVS
jgi:adenosylcobyric acid synthase